LRPLAEERATAFEFQAGAGDKTTTVIRTCVGWRLPRRPRTGRPRFFVAPVSPRGDLIVPAGGEVPVTLYASPGMKAEIKVGELPWARMQQTETDERRGGVYKNENSTPPLGDSGRQLHPVSFG